MCLFLLHRDDPFFDAGGLRERSPTGKKKKANSVYRRLALFAHPDKPSGNAKEFEDLTCALEIVKLGINGHNSDHMCAQHIVAASPSSSMNPMPPTCPNIYQNAGPESKFLGSFHHHRENPPQRSWTTPTTHSGLLYPLRRQSCLNDPNPTTPQKRSCLRRHADSLRGTALFKPGRFLDRRDDYLYDGLHGHASPSACLKCAGALLAKDKKTKKQGLSS